MLNVYTPSNYDSKSKYPTVVAAHPNGGVKEQVAGLYAQKLAEQGYITIVADASYQGAMVETPRNRYSSNRRKIFMVWQILFHNIKVQIHKLALQVFRMCVYFSSCTN